MSINTNGVGFEVSAWGFELALFVGDIRVRIPRVIDVAWNHTGFYADRL